MDRSHRGSNLLAEPVFLHPHPVTVGALPFQDFARIDGERYPKKDPAEQAEQQSKELLPLLVHFGVWWKRRSAVATRTLKVIADPSNRHADLG